MGRLWLAVSVTLTLFVARPAWAGPRDEAMQAHSQAIAQFNNLELEEALETLDTAIAQAKTQGLGEDPIIAPLIVLRAGIIHSTSGNRAETVAGFQEAVRADYNVVLPIELRSDELKSLLEKARQQAGSAPTQAVIHTPPNVTVGEDIEIVAQMGVPMYEDYQVALYWRRTDDKGEFETLRMSLFGTVATATIPASAYGKSNVQYFIYAFDANKGAIANLGSEQAPVELAIAGASDEPVVEPEPAPEDDKKPKRRRGGGGGIPRGFVNIGIGTGMGIAHGHAELSYRPLSTGSYGIDDQACAIARWARPDQLPTRDELEATFQGMQAYETLGILPSSADALVSAYDREACSERTPIDPAGTASSPFFVEPELAFRLGKLPLTLGVYGRLQVVSGSKMYYPDPGKNTADSWNQDVNSPDPDDFRLKPPKYATSPALTWALGAKLRYFFGKDERKFRLFAGGYFGYGFARLRLPINGAEKGDGVANDRNGNSIPDDSEVSHVGERGGPDCVPVWPYNAACDVNEFGNPTADAEDADRLARSVSDNTPSGDRIIDTVVLGQGFVGGMFGFNWQLHKNFALFAEIQIGGWFPNTSSMLIDLNLGPAITW